MLSQDGLSKESPVSSSGKEDNPLFSSTKKKKKKSIGAQEDLQYFLPTIEVCRKGSNEANASSFPLVAAKMSKLRRLSWRGNHNASFHNCVAMIFAGGSNGMMASRQGDWHSIAESSSIQQMVVEE